MRLNLGCGDRYAEGGWWNVDLPSCPYRVDEVVDLRGPLPWPAGSVEYAYAGHLLEHLTLPECAVLAARLLTCMAAGGRLMVVGPDVAYARQMAEAGSLDVTMESLVHGGHRWVGDEHQWECGPDAVAKLLTDVGWADVAKATIGDVDAMWPVADRRPVWQFAVSARRGIDDA